MLLIKAFQTDLSKARVIRRAHILTRSAICRPEDELSIE